MTFSELNLIAPILKAVAEEGYEIPTPIQEQAIPLLLEGRDLVGCAQTGTGKTAAFAIPILQMLSSKPHNPAHKKAIRCLILTPTRELALQIADSLTSYGRHLSLKTTVVFGGVSQGAQTETLKKGVDILVATPGRLLDLIGQKFIELHHVEIFVLDEADRMLDMGFAPDVKRVIAMLPEIRQNMLFSATMPPEIVKLVDKLLREPVKVAVTPVSSTVDTITQSVYFVGKKEKRLLLTHLLQDESLRSVLVFTRTKHGADRVTKDLIRAGITVAAIHGDKSQNNRVAALTQFKARKIRVLVATDIAARGIDVDDMSHVVNFDLPNVPETYVHRIGRTGRAGLEGVAISFCDEEEKAYLKDIQKLIGKQVPVVLDQPYPLEAYVEPERTEDPADRQRGRGRRPAPAGAGRSADGRRGSPDIQEFERIAAQLVDRSGHTAGRSGRKRDVIRDQADRAGVVPRSGTSRTGEGSPRGDSRQASGSGSVRTDSGRGSGNNQSTGRSAGARPDSGRQGSSRTDAGRTGAGRSDSARSGAGRSDAGRSGATRNDGARAGAGRSDTGRSGATRNDGARTGPTRNDGGRQTTGRPIPARKPADSRPSVDEDVRTYTGIAAEKPGPFESASFLSQPTRRPKDL